MKKFAFVSAFLTLLLSFTAYGAQVPAKGDILIVGGTLYDGSDSPSYKADIIISGDKVVYVGAADPKIQKKCKAAKVINAEGYVVCPGFIDPHDHLESYLKNPKTKGNEPYLRMGVTTVIPGMCGGSQYPIRKFFATLEEQGIGTNVASFTGHGTIRERLMKSEARYATDEEIAKMQEMIRQEMKDGSLGLSTGLFYVPGCFSETREVEAIAAAMAPLGGIYTTHVRNENKDGIGLVASIREALEIGRVAGVQVNISHIKCLGRSTWHLSDSVINLIESYQKAGMTVTADQYPYLASGVGMASALTPAWSRDGGLKGFRSHLDDSEWMARLRAELPSLIYERGGAETIFLARKAGDYTRMTLAEAAAKMGLTPEEAIIEMLRTMSPSLNTFVMCDDDVENFMRQPWVLSCTDGSLGLHPRATGSYAVLIQDYVVKKGTISLDRFIRRSTGQVADTYRLPSRGYIRKGYNADIVIFKPEEVRANSTFADPKIYATGFKNVIVNGKVAIENDVYTGSLSGQVIRREVTKEQLDKKY